MNHIAISYGLKETHSFTLHRVPVINVAHNAVHDQFCSLDERGLRLWDTVKGSRNKVTFPIAQKNFIHTLTWVQALNVYFASALDMTLRVYDDKLTQLQTIFLNQRAVLSLHYDSARNQLFTAGIDGVIAWDVKTRAERIMSETENKKWVMVKLFELTKTKHVFDSEKKWVKHFTIKGPYVYMLWDENISIFSTEDDKHVATLLKIHGSAVTSYYIYESLQYLITGGADATVKVWNLSQLGTPVHTFRNYRKAVTGIIAHGETMIITTSLDKQLTVIDIETLSVLYSLNLGTPIHAVLRLPIENKSGLVVLTRLLVVSGSVLTQWELQDLTQLWGVCRSTVSTLSRFQILYRGGKATNHDSHQSPPASPRGLKRIAGEKEGSQGQLIGNPLSKKASTGAMVDSSDPEKNKLRLMKRNSMMVQKGGLIKKSSQLSMMEKLNEEKHVENAILQSASTPQPIAKVIEERRRSSIKITIPPKPFSVVKNIFVSKNDDGSVRIFNGDDGRVVSTLLPDAVVSTLVAFEFSAVQELLFLLLRSGEILVYSTRSEICHRLQIWKPESITGGNADDVPLCILLSSKAPHWVPPTYESSVRGIVDPHSGNSSITAGGRSPKRSSTSEYSSQSQHRKKSAIISKKKETHLEHAEFNHEGYEQKQRNNVRGYVDHGDAEYLIVGTKRGHIVYLDVRQNGLVYVSLGAHKERVTWIYFDERLNTLISATDKGEMKFWDAGTLKLKRVINETYFDNISCIGFSPYHSLIYIGTKVGKGHMITSNGEVHKWGDNDTDLDHYHPIVALSFCNTSKGLIVTVGMNESVKVWHISRVLLAEIELPFHSRTISFLNERGDLLVGGNQDIYKVPFTIYERVYTKFKTFYSDTLLSEKSANDGAINHTPVLKAKASTNNLGDNNIVVRESMNSLETFIHATSKSEVNSIQDVNTTMREDKADDPNAGSMDDLTEVDEDLLLVEDVDDTVDIFGNISEATKKNPLQEKQKYKGSHSPLASPYAPAVSDIDHILLDRQRKVTHRDLPESEGSSNINPAIEDIQRSFEKVYASTREQGTPPLSSPVIGTPKSTSPHPTVLSPTATASTKGASMVYFNNMRTSASPVNKTTFSSTPFFGPHSEDAAAKGDSGGNKAGDTANASKLNNTKGGRTKDASVIKSSTSFTSLSLPPSGVTRGEFTEIQQLAHFQAATAKDSRAPQSTTLMDTSLPSNNAQPPRAATMTVSDDLLVVKSCAYGATPTGSEAGSVVGEDEIDEINQLLGYTKVSVVNITLATCSPRIARTKYLSRKKRKGPEEVVPPPVFTAPSFLPVAPPQSAGHHPSQHQRHSNTTTAEVVKSVPIKFAAEPLNLFRQRLLIEGKVGKKLV